MIRSYLVVVASLWAQGLAAQGTVVLPEPALDAGRATLRDELLRFRDTLNTVDAASARLQRDYRQVSAAALTSRARVMSDACARSARSTATAQKAVLAADASDKRRLQSQAELLKTLDRLRGVLSRCAADFADMSKPEASETVRGYGNNRAVRVQSEIRQYERVLATFFHSMGIKVTPLGSRARPVAG